MTRLDHNRAQTQVASKLGVQVSDVKKMTIWGTIQQPNTQIFSIAKLTENPWHTQ